jgi:hypothetical protein
MKRIALLVGLLALGGCTHVELGHVGIEVQQCGGGGVTLVGTGYHATGACTSIVEYPDVRPDGGVDAQTRTRGTPGTRRSPSRTRTRCRSPSTSAWPTSWTREKVRPSTQVQGRRARQLHARLPAQPGPGEVRHAGGKYPIEQIMGDNAAFLKEVRGPAEDVDPYGVKHRPSSASSARRVRRRPSSTASTPRPRPRRRRCRSSWS